MDLGNCRLTYANGQASAFDSVPAINNWTNGTITMMNVETLYVDMTNRMLKRFSDLNNNQAIDPNEDVIVADNIFDLQVGLGYDFNLADGNVSETVNGLNDEWLFNAPGAVETFGAGYFVPPLTRSQLHSVHVAVMMGTQDPVGNSVTSPFRMLNGPLRSQAGWILVEEWTRVMPRNSYVFQ